MLRQYKTAQAIVANGVLHCLLESERWIVVGRRVVWIGMDEVVKGSILVEAMNLAAVTGFEEAKEIGEEVVNLDDGLIGDWRQADLYGIGIRAHNGHRDAVRRGVAVSGWAKTSR